MSDPLATAAASRASARAWLLLVFLTALNVLNFVDRTLISSLGPLLIKDLGLSRAQIGLLAGFGFVFFYSLVGIFLGIAADRWRRIPLVSIGVALWSAMTALSGLARSFVQLALPRIFVGVGEATLGPSALSMLGDGWRRRPASTTRASRWARRCRSSPPVTSRRAGAGGPASTRSASPASSPRGCCCWCASRRDAARPRAARARRCARWSATPRAR